MTDEHLKELADYRLQQARETLQEAEGLFKPIILARHDQSCVLCHVLRGPCASCFTPASDLQTQRGFSFF